MAEILVRVGAAIDPSIQNVFRSIIDGSNRASEAVGRGAKRGATNQKGELAAMSKAARAYADSMRAIDKAQADSAARSSKAKNQAEKKSFDERLRLAQQAKKDREKLARDEVKVLEQLERASAQRRNALWRQSDQQRQRDARRREALGRGFTNNVTSNVAGVARGAAGLAGAAVRGTGFDTDLTGMFRRGVGLEQMSVDLSNQAANVPGATRTDPKLIADKIRSVADLTARGREDIGAGLGAYVTRTGELDSGLATMEDLAKLSKVAGQNFEDMGGAAGEVSNALGNMPVEQKAKKLVDLMNTFTVQGGMGAVELKDFASGFGKVGAASTRFEGDAAQNLKMMGAMVQLARSKGGAASAREAVTSIAGMANTFATPARVKAFEREGISVFNEESGLIRDPSQIIMEALEKTRGDPTRFKGMFANVIGAKPAEAMASTFRRTRADAMGGGASEEEATRRGLKAVREELDKFANATMDAAKFEESFQATMNTTASKAQVAQNRFDDIAARLNERTIPALERLEPTLYGAADAFAGAAGWAAENPMAAAATAVTGAIAYSGIQSAFASVAASAGPAVAGLSLIAAAGVAGGLALKKGYDALDQEKSKSSVVTSDRGIMLDRASRAASKKARGLALTPEEQSAYEQKDAMLAEIAKERAGAKDLMNPGTFLAAMGNEIRGSGPGFDSIWQKKVWLERDAQNATLERQGQTGSMQDIGARIEAAIRAGMAGVKLENKVEVTVNNPQGVNEGARDSGSISPGIRRGEL